jgi:hypothetical protein
MSETSPTEEPIRIAIGSEPMQWVAAEVLKHSILRRTTRPVEFLESWTRPGGWHPVFKMLPPLRGGTAFNVWRWALPSLYDHGKAIYLDADQIVLSDIGELWDSLAVPGPHAIACVCNAVGIFGKKKIPEPGKVQTSVMVANVDQLRMLQVAGRVQSRAVDGSLPYADLMQAAWIPRAKVLELPPEWNHFGIVRPETKLVHFSHVASQPYRCPDHPHAETFARELRECVESGILTTVDLGREAERGYLHGVYVKRLRRDAA